MSIIIKQKAVESHCTFYDTTFLETVGISPAGVSTPGFLKLGAKVEESSTSVRYLPFMALNPNEVPIHATSPIKQKAIQLNTKETEHNPIPIPE